MTPPRLIERAFPLKQTSLDSVHEKNVRHGHISTLHIWPARAPWPPVAPRCWPRCCPTPPTPKSAAPLSNALAGGWWKPS